MKAIYEPAGAAREYAPLACNLYAGCLHGCSYCYVPGCLRKSRSDFNATVTARAGILEQLEKDADRMVKDGNMKRVLFSFTSDPYQPFPEGVDITRQALQIMVDRGIPFEVCTKGGIRAERDFDLLKQGGRLGVSLVWWEETLREQWEPNAASVGERYQLISRAYRHGIPTWISVEPVIDPSEAMRVLNALRIFPVEFRIGKINHCKELEEAVDWQAFVDEAYDMLTVEGKTFMLKESLWPYLNGRPANAHPTRQQLPRPKRLPLLHDLRTRRVVRGRLRVRQGRNLRLRLRYRYLR